MTPQTFGSIMADLEKRYGNASFNVTVTTTTGHQFKGNFEHLGDKRRVPLTNEAVIIGGDYVALSAIIAIEPFIN